MDLISGKYSGFFFIFKRKFRLWRSLSQKLHLFGAQLLRQIRTNKHMHIYNDQKSLFSLFISHIPRIDFGQRSVTISKASGVERLYVASMSSLLRFFDKSGRIAGCKIRMQVHYMINRFRPWTMWCVCVPQVVDMAMYERAAAISVKRLSRKRARMWRYGFNLCRILWRLGINSSAIGARVNCWFTVSRRCPTRWTFTLGCAQLASWKFLFASGFGTKNDLK